MIELSIFEKYKLQWKAKKIYNKSCLYLWISEKEYPYSDWEKVILKWGNHLFYDVLIDWIDGKELTDFEIESLFYHYKIAFSEILEFWQNDFITALWLAIQLYQDFLNNEEIKYPPDCIAYRLWRKKYVH